MSTFGDPDGNPADECLFVLDAIEVKAVLEGLGDIPQSPHVLVISAQFVEGLKCG